MDKPPVDKNEHTNGFLNEVNNIKPSSGSTSGAVDGSIGKPISGSMADSIDESIDELENLIAENALSPKLKTKIPVLNDIIEPAEVRKYVQTEAMATSPAPAANAIEDFPAEKLNELVNTVDQKLSTVLGPLVDTLKEKVKESIMNELKIQLKKEASQTQSPPAVIDSPDTPAK